MHLVLVLIVAALGVGIAPAKGADDCMTDDQHPSESATTGVSVTAQRADTQVRVSVQAKKAIIDVRSPTGIDKATVKRIGKGWPKAIVIRLHLKGLESCKATVGEMAVEWSVSSSGNHASRVTLHKDNGAIALDQTSPFYSAARIVGDPPTIPLAEGYFEIALPSRLLKDNPSDFTLRWIDFYRN